MITSFSDFISHLVGARFTFTYLWELLLWLFASLTADGEILGSNSDIINYLSGAMAYMPYILIGAGLIIALFGKKMGSFLKFVAFFGAGYVLGIHFLAPVIPSEVHIPAWVVGLVVAFVAAILSKFVFGLTVSLSILYSVYRLCYHGFFLDPESGVAMGKAVTALAVAAIVLIIALVLFKYIEMLLFATLGAYMVTAGFSWAFFDLGSVAALGANSWILEVAVIGVLALLAFAFQVKTRRRY